MAWPASENFDSYANGDALNGKNGGSGWSSAWALAGGAPTISNAQAQSGTLSAKFTGADDYAYRNFTASDGDEMEIYVFPTSGTTNAYGAIEFRSGGSSRADIRVNYLSNGALYVNDGASNVNVGTVTGGAWNKIRVVLRASTNKFDVYLNDALVASDYNMTNSGAITRMYINCSTSGGESVYYDSIQPYTAPAPSARAMTNMRGPGGGASVGPLTF
jgi:hypothetical protein